ncbi:hypothetical protein ACNKHW_12740 [Shigella flexneri]
MHSFITAFSVTPIAQTTKIVLETEPRNLPALDITFVDKRIEKLLFNYLGRATSRDAGLCRAATLAGAPPPGIHTEFLQGYAGRDSDVAQQYADDKKKWRC